MLGDVLAGDRAQTGHNVDHAVRHAGSAISSAIFSELSGVISAGFRTIQLPAASAGAIFQLVNISGKFHGTTWPTTPNGSRDNS